MRACCRWIGVGLVLTLWSATESSGMPATPEWDSVSTESPTVLVYNEDQLKGQWKQFKGEMKKKWAEFTDDDLLYVEGNRDKLEGKIQERYGDRREEVERWVDEWFERHPSKPHKSSH